MLQHQCKPKLNRPEGGSVTLLHTLTSKQTISSCDNTSRWPAIWRTVLTAPLIEANVEIYSQLRWVFMYVNAITHARMHVWLCDNAGPAWQAPCIIALGRELHNNVGLGLGNACGLGPSAVSGPVKVLLYSLPVGLQPVLSHTHTHKLWEKDEAHFFMCEEARAFTSHLNGEIIQNPYKLPLLTPSNNAEAFLLTQQEIFPIFPTEEKLRWQKEQQPILWNKRPCLGKPTAKTDDHMLSACYYQTRTEKNKTIWLILNDCLPDHGAGCQLYFFSSRVKQPAWAPVGFVLLNEAAGIFLYITYTLSYWTLHSLNDLSTGL